MKTLRDIVIASVLLTIAAGCVEVGHYNHGDAQAIVVDLDDALNLLDNDSVDSAGMCVLDPEDLKNSRIIIRQCAYNLDSLCQEWEEEDRRVSEWENRGRD